MNRKSRRVLFLVLLVLAFLAVAALAYRYIPFNKFFKVKAADETGFLNPPQGSAHAPNTLFFDFEVAPGTDPSGRLYAELAHSGKSCSKAFGKNSYSISFERTAGEIGVENLKGVSMSAWIYLFPGTNDPLGSLVFAASNKKINVAWKGVTIKGQDIPRGKWFKISGFFDLSGIEFKPDYRLEFYFWNNSDNDFLVDDIFISFFGSSERPGDSTLVDLTRAPYSPRFNFPPFPVEYLQRQEIGNGNTEFMVRKGDVRGGEVLPTDRLFAGSFTTPLRGMDDLLVVGKSGDIEMFSFCSDRQEFRKINPVVPASIKAAFRDNRILTGSFTAASQEEVVLAGKNGLSIGSFSRLRDACAENGTTVEFRLLGQSAKNPFNDTDTLLTGDFLGNRQHLILAVKGDGSWALYRYEKEQAEMFALMAKGTTPIPDWNKNDYVVRMTSGRFLAGQPADQLLTVSKNHRKGNATFAFLRFDSAAKRFILIPAGGSAHGWKTIGMDTLRPSDELIPAPLSSAGRPEFYRYNHDLRFDLKRFIVTDTTYQILARIDFTGYDHDFNPKYFEMLRILQGRFMAPDQTVVLVIGTNCKTRDPKTGECTGTANLSELPNVIQIYSPIPGTQK